MRLLTKTELEQERQAKIRSKQTRYDTSKLALIYSRQSTKNQPIKNKEAALMQRDELIEYAVTSYHWPEENCVLFVENELDRFGRKLDKPRAASGRIDMNFRPGLLEVERLVEEGKAGAVFVRDVSRLFRDEEMINPPSFAKKCKAHNVIIVTYDAEFDFNAVARDDLKDFLEEAQAAADYLKTLRRTLHRAKQRKGDRGEYVGSSIATGYMLDSKHKFLVPCPVWCDVITWLYKRFRELDGNLYELYTEICGVCLFKTLPDELQARVGHVQLSAVPGGYTISTRSALKYILTNPMYLGHKTYRKRIVRYNSHLPLTTQENFDFALERLGEVDLDGEIIERPKSVKRFTQGQKREGLLSGTRSDGSPVVGSSQGFVYVFQYGGRTSYSIRDNRFGGKAYSGSIPIEDIDTLVSTRLEEKLKQLTWHAEVERFHGGNPEYGAQAVLNHVAKLKQQVGGSLGKLNESIKDVEKTIARKQHDYDVASDVMSDADIREHYASLARLRTRLDDLKKKQNQVSKVDADIESVTKNLNRASNEWGSFTLEQKRSFIRLITESISLDALSDRWAKITIEWSPVIAGEQYREYALLLRTQGAGANWRPEEDAILCEMYPTSSRSDILSALPHRAWIAVRYRASALQIKRNVKVREPESIPAELSLKDMAIMAEHGVTEAQIAAGQHVWWAIVDTVKNVDVYALELKPSRSNNIIASAAPVKPTSPNMTSNGSPSSLLLFFRV